MQRFIDFLLQEPLILIILLSWILTLVGKALSAGHKQRQRQLQQQRGQQRQGAPGGGPAARQAPPAAGGGARGGGGGGRPSADEVAAEMRRILGMDQPPAAPQRPRPQPRERSQPAPLRGQTPAAQVRREPASGPTPVRVEVVRDRPRPAPRIGGLTTRVESKVGQRMRSRRGPYSGSVGGSQLGQLGGRIRRAAGSTPDTGSRLVDLSYLTRMIVMKEILDRPLGLRDLP